MTNAPKSLKFGCNVLRFRQNFCSDFSRMMKKKCVLPIFATFPKKYFVKDQKCFRGTCCCLISGNLLTIYLTYAENGLVKTNVFWGTPLNEP